MASFDELKKKAVDAAGTVAGKAVEAAGYVADKSVEIAKIAAEKAIVLGKIAKLKTEISFENDTIKRTYNLLGRFYYEKFRENPDDEMAQAVADIDACFDRIDEKRREIESLKADEAQYESVVEEETCESAPEDQNGAADTAGADVDTADVNADAAASDSGTADDDASAKEASADEAAAEEKTKE